MTWQVHINDAAFKAQIELVDAVNSAKTQYEHDIARAKLDGWREGVQACGVSWMPCDVDLEIMSREGFTGAEGERPLCCGVYLDWEPS